MRIIQKILSESEDALYFAGRRIDIDRGLKKKRGPIKGYKVRKNTTQLEPYTDFLELSGDLDWPI